MKLHTYCRNDYCGDPLDLRALNPFGFCPSCWIAAKTGFKYGAILLGVIAAVVRVLWR